MLNDMREGLGWQPIYRLQEVPQRGYDFQNVVRCGFEAFDLKGQPLDPIRATFIDKGPLTSVSREGIKPSGGRQYSCVLVHSRPSFLFNARSNSRTERLRAASKDMMAAKGVAG